MAEITLLVKPLKDKPYIITDFMATRLSKKDFERLQELNPELLKDWRYTPRKETDFSWWSKVTKKLTKTKIVTAYFDIDFYGNVSEY